MYLDIVTYYASLLSWGIVKKRNYCIFENWYPISVMHGSVYWVSGVDLRCMDTSVNSDTMLRSSHATTNLLFVCHDLFSASHACTRFYDLNKEPIHQVSIKRLSSMIHNILGIILFKGSWVAQLCRVVYLWCARNLSLRVRFTLITFHHTLLIWPKW